jgi:tRNA A-37 threonylcarbamoyl transferase component Bud32
MVYYYIAMSENAKAQVLFCPRCGDRYPDGVQSCTKDGQVLLPVGIDDDLSGTKILDKYLLVQRLGKGAFGAVYRAFHLVAKTDVAVKVLHSEIVRQDAKTSKMAKDTFVREARAQMGMQSRHVVIVHDVDEDPVVGPFVVMEFVQGVTLDKYVEMTAPDRKRLPLGEVISIAMQVCDALEDAHERGIVHRDLKPSNIMILRGKDGGVFAKVLDFGIAKIAHKEGTDLTTLASLEGIVGTPAYMSPEQCGGQPVDVRSDIYTLGVILYELCTGMLPFRGSSALAFIVAHATQNPRAVTEVVDKREVPRELDRLIGSMLKKKPEERPQTISEVKEALTRLETRKVKPRGGMRYVWGGVVALVVLGLLSGVFLWKSEGDETGTLKQVLPAQNETVAGPQVIVEPVKSSAQKAVPNESKVGTETVSKQEALQASGAGDMGAGSKKAEVPSGSEGTKKKRAGGKKERGLDEILPDKKGEGQVDTRQGKGTKTEEQNIWDKFLGE